MNQEIYEDLKKEYIKNPVKSDIIQLAKERYQLSLADSKKILDEIADEVYAHNKEITQQEKIAVERMIDYSQKKFSLRQYIKHSPYLFGYVILAIAIFSLEYKNPDGLQIILLIKHLIKSQPILFTICAVILIYYSIWHASVYVNSYFQPFNPNPYYIIARPWSSKSVKAQFPEQDRNSNRIWASKEYRIRKIENITNLPNKIVITGVIDLEYNELDYHDTKTTKRKTITQFSIPKYYAEFDKIISYLEYKQHNSTKQ